MTNPYKDYDKKFPAGGGGGGLFFKPAPDTTTKLRIFSLAHHSLNEYEGETKDAYSWVVWNYDEEKAQILSKGRSVFNQIAELSQDEDWGDPTTYDIKFKRTGDGLETRYTVTPSPSKGTLTEEQVAELENTDITKAVKGAISIEQKLIDQDNGVDNVKSILGA